MAVGGRHVVNGLVVIVVLVSIQQFSYVGAALTSCYNGLGLMDSTTNLCYIYQGNLKTQSDAIANCAQIGATLASIENSTQQQTIQQVLQASGTNSRVWLAGYQQQTPFQSANWRWIRDCTDQRCGKNGEANLAILQQGCYHDNPTNRDLPYQVTGLSSTLTPTSCINACSAQGFAYAAVQAGSQCFCGNSYGRYGRLDTLNEPANGYCATSCSGDSSLFCGGTDLNYVYYIAGSRNTVEWGYLKPNNYAGNQFCAVMNSAIGYKLDDDDCATAQTDFICQIPTNSCPTLQYGYYSIQSNCYYVSSGRSVSWFGARQECFLIGGDLATINTTTLRTTLSPSLSSSKYWVGLVGRVWYWINNGNDFVYTNWFRTGGDVSLYEPNLLGNDCVVTDPTNGYTWFDASCTQTFNYICQLDARTLTTTVPTTTIKTTAVTTPTTAMTTLSTTTTTTTTTTTIAAAAAAAITTNTPPTTATTSIAASTPTTPSSTLSMAITTTTTTTKPTITPTLTTAEPSTTLIDLQQSSTTPVSQQQLALTSTQTRISTTDPSALHYVSTLANMSGTTIDKETSSGYFNASDSGSGGGVPNVGQSTGSSSSGISTGIIVLIVICIVLFIVAVICVVLYFWNKTKHHKKVDYRFKASVPDGAAYFDRQAKDTDKIIIA